MKKHLPAKKPLLAPLVLLTLLLSLLLPSSGMAMNSANYQLAWFAPMTGTGSFAQSPNYHMDLTVGQTVTGSIASPGFTMNLGYWQNWDELMIFLPVVAK